MKNNQKSSEVDFITPIVEVFHFVVSSMVKVTYEVLKLGYNRYFNKNPQIKKIERKALQYRGQTKIETALGIDTNTKRPVLLSDINFKRHSFIVGGSGYGKTNLMSILQENSLKQGMPIYFFDPKGDLQALETFKALCKKYGRECHIFSEHYADSIKLNPVLEGTVGQVLDRIMSSFNWGKEPYYKDYARGSLNNVLTRLKLEQRPFTINAILQLLKTVQDKDNLGLITKLDAIDNSDFGPLLSGDKHSLTLSKIRQSQACLYVGLSVQGYAETARSVGKLFLGELLYNSYKCLSTINDDRYSSKNPVSIYFDEFGAIVTPEFIELHNKCRAAGMELTIAVQTASDIDRVDPTLTKQILENSGNYFILKQRLDESASLFSNAIGTIITTKQTHVIEEGTVQERGSVRETNELVVHPDIIKNLEVGQCILLRQAPTRLNLINIRERK